MDYGKIVEHTLFEAAAGLADPEQRSAFLDQSCHGNQGLRARLDELLGSLDRAEDFFDLPSVKIPSGVTRMAILDGEEGVPPDQAVALVGTDSCIGRYRILNRLGEGGCGVVYRAEQTEPVRRMVALKIIRLGMDTEGMIVRFKLERQALAMMDHPNIARVLDAGATSTGRSFFVMELVEGERITGYCDQQGLEVRQRLELFIQICLAIQHAHHKGVIHRDIKPSNVLVRQHDGEPVPKVIDFGIAKATTDVRPEDTTFTAFEQFIGTPASMSPEQAAGGVDIDTRTDIYSLGVLLYELLAGRPPFDPKQLQQAGVDEIRRILRDVEPPTPSAAVASLSPPELKDLAARRHTEPQKLVSQLRGDLDWIVMKAMAKDRTRRYETPYGLAMEVQRHLRNEPVTAGPPDRRYRFQKLVRRNKSTFVAGTLLLTALIGGLGTSNWLYLKEKDARREQQRLRDVADAACASEIRQRELAELREMVAQAAVRIHHDDPSAADVLLARIPVELTPSSLEAANTFLSVGEWHVMAGRWEQAADRFASLARAMTSVDPSDSDNVSQHLLPAAAVLGQWGNSERYEWVRHMAIERFAGTSHPVVAEQVVKASLLLPADEPTLAALEPLAEIIGRAVESGASAYGGNRDLEAWSCFSLALMHYRKADFALAAEWANRCFAVPDHNSPRNASAQLILAMAEHRFGRTAKARALLEMAETSVDQRFTSTVQFTGGEAGFWFDWVNARILLREVSALIAK
jgi:serine/threonine protein kinase